MATTSNNNTKVDFGRKFSYPCKKDGTADINQGDIVYSDSGIAKSIGSDANANTLLGVALKGSYIQSVDGGTPYGQKLYVDSMEIGYGSVFSFYTTAGDTYNNEDPVYFSGDAQTITNTAGAMTHPIGHIYLPNGNSVTGAAGVKVDVIVFTKLAGALQI